MIEIVDANTAKAVEHYEEIFESQQMKIRELERFNYDTMQTLEEERHIHAEQLLSDREAQAK